MQSDSGTFLDEHIAEFERLSKNLGRYSILSYFSAVILIIVGIFAAIALPYFLAAVDAKYSPSLSVTKLNEDVDEIEASIKNKLESLNQRVWVRSSTPFTNFRDIAISPTNGIAVAVASEGLIYVSTEGGKKWDVHDFSREADSLSFKSIDFTTDGTAWILTYDSKVLISNNNGETWNVRALPFKPLSIITAPNGAVVLKDKSNFYMSKNGGETWDYIKVPSSSWLDTLFFNPDGLLIFLTSESKLFVSSNEGSTWTLSEDLKRPAYHVSSDFSADGVGIILYSNKAMGNATGGIISKDGGLTWKSFELPDSKEIFSVVFSPAGIGVMLA